MSAAPGWYQDPYGNPSLIRYWDGVQWTDHVQVNQAFAQPYTSVGPQGQAAYQQPGQPTVQNIYVSQNMVAGRYQLKQSDKNLRLIAFILDLLGIISLLSCGLMLLIGGTVFLPFYSDGYEMLAAMMAAGIFAPMLLIPLAWYIPMTVHTYSLYKGKKANSVAFGVCSLLFMGLIPGILLLCSTKEI